MNTAKEAADELRQPADHQTRLEVDGVPSIIVSLSAYATALHVLDAAARREAFVRENPSQRKALAEARGIK